MSAPSPVGPPRNAMSVDVEDWFQVQAFAHCIRRDSWVEQAKFLAEGDTAGFEGKFGKL